MQGPGFRAQGPGHKGREGGACTLRPVPGWVAGVGVSCILHLGGGLGGCILCPDGRVCGQAFCLHATVSCAIVPLPLPIGRGVFFVKSEKTGVEVLLA